MIYEIGTTNTGTNTAVADEAAKKADEAAKKMDAAKLAKAICKQKFGQTCAACTTAGPTTCEPGYVSDSRANMCLKPAAKSSVQHCGGVSDYSGECSWCEFPRFAVFANQNGGGNQNGKYFQRCISDPQELTLQAQCTDAERFNLSVSPVPLPISAPITTTGVPNCLMSSEDGKVCQVCTGDLRPNNDGTACECWDGSQRIGDCPARPVPTFENGAVRGVFQISNQDYLKCPKFDSWGACAAFPKSPEVILFAGSSKIDHPEQIQTEGPQVYDITPGDSYWGTNGAYNQVSQAGARAAHHGTSLFTNSDIAHSSIDGTTWFPFEDTPITDHAHWQQVTKVKVQGKIYSQGEKISSEGKLWYNIGGGGVAENRHFTQQHLNDLNALIGTVITTDTHYGIMYDIESIMDVNTDFHASFALAKQHGLKVLVSTSYTAPYKAWPTPIPANYPYSLIDFYRAILMDPNVDIHTPQFYNYGIVETSLGECESLGSWIGFRTWTQLIPPHVKIMPMVKVVSDNNVEQVNNWIERMENKCKNEPEFKRFCDSGSYYLWSAN